MGIREHEPEFWAFLTEEAENKARDRARERQTFMERTTCPNCFKGPWNCHCEPDEVFLGWERLRTRAQADHHRRIKLFEEEQKDTNGKNH